MHCLGMRGKADYDYFADPGILDQLLNSEHNDPGILDQNSDWSNKNYIAYLGAALDPFEWCQK
jgi:hypothetical protein